MKHLLLISLCLPLVASAQQEDPKKYLRFLPLGERPPNEDKIVDGVRIQQEYPPGTMPPADISIATSGSDFENHNLRLSQFSKVVEVKKSAGGIKITEGKTPGGKEFISTSRLPAKPYTLAVLYRDSTEMTWFKPKMLILPEDLASFPYGKVRFVNTSPFEVAVILGKEKAFPIAPGKIVFKTLKKGDTLATIAVKNNAGAYKKVTQSSITMRDKQRVQAFFYKAQGKNPKRPVDFMIKPEFYKSPTGK